MADENKDQAAQQQSIAASGTIANQSLALSEAAKLAEEQSIDEGEPGGHYIVNGVHVNADGEPIKKYNKG